MKRICSLLVLVFMGASFVDAATFKVTIPDENLADVVVAIAWKHNYQAMVPNPAYDMENPTANSETITNPEALLDFSQRMMGERIKQTHDEYLVYLLGQQQAAERDSVLQTIAESALPISVEPIEMVADTILDGSGT